MPDTYVPPKSSSETPTRDDIGWWIVERLGYIADTTEPSGAREGVVELVTDLSVALTRGWQMDSADEIGVTFTALEAKLAYLSMEGFAAHIRGQDRRDNPGKPHVRPHAIDATQAKIRLAMRMTDVQVEAMEEAVVQWLEPAVEAC